MRAFWRKCVSLLTEKNRAVCVRGTARGSALATQARAAAAPNPAHALQRYGLRGRDTEAHVFPREGRSTRLRNARSGEESPLGRRARALLFYVACTTMLCASH